MPELAKYEIGNALLNKGMDLLSTQGTISAFYAIPIQFISQDAEMAKTAIEIAQKSKITYYDASFLALAENIRADLITDNPKHQKKYQEKEIKIIPLKNYK